MSFGYVLTSAVRFTQILVYTQVKIQNVTKTFELTVYHALLKIIAKKLEKRSNALQSGITWNKCVVKLI